ncbi:MAG: hypothetical protein RR704_00955 [Stenotrophomonas sp.]
MNDRLGNYPPTAINACDKRDPNEAVSQVDEALEEHAKVLSQLSEELIRSRSCFRAVLMPDVPTGCTNEASPVPILSPLAETITGQTKLARTMLLDLRSLNNRSTV